MTKESVKIEEEQKERLDELRDNFKYAEPSYSGLIEYLLDVHDGEVDGGEELPDSGSNVTRTSAGGDVQSSGEDDDFLGDEGENQGLTAEEKAARFRVNE